MMEKKPNIKKPRGKILQILSRYFRNQPFYLQSQMDIHPRSRFYNLNFINETGGFGREIIYDVPWDNVRRDMLVLLLKDIMDIPGDMVELGVYKGHTAKLIHHYLPERKLYLFDTFSGFDKKDLERENKRTGHDIGSHFNAWELSRVIKYIDPVNNNVFPIVGVFPRSIVTEFNQEFAFVHIDMDLYEPTFLALEYFYSKVSPGGYIVIHDYNSWSGARNAVDEFFKDKPESPIPMPDKNGSAVVKKL